MPYTPSGMPAISDVESLRRFVEEEFRRVAQNVTSNDRVMLNILYAAPPDPQAGMLVFADGTTWNPGSGRGVYEYRTSSWVKL